LRRPLAIAFAIAALAGGAVLALVLGGGDNGKSGATGTDATSPSTTREPSVDHTLTRKTETATRTTPPPPKQDARGIERAVVMFVEAAEQSDSNRACAQLVGGAGKQLPGCAEALGIDPRTLPSSAQLDFRAVRASGDSGRARLTNGSAFSLRRSAGRWLIAGFRT
jgi:hypothetical protein